MASKLLPQALIITPTQCPSRKLGFSSFLSRRPSSSFVSGAPTSASRFSSPSIPWNLSSVVAALPKPSFVVRAESNSEAGVVVDDNVEDNEAVEESEEPEAEESKPPRKPRVKLGDVMGILNKRAIEAAEKERPVPDIRTGDILEIKLEVPENKRRLSVYKGIVMSRQNAGIHTTIRIRRIIAGVGVEIVFPLYSPNIKEIKVVKHRKVRRARLYYLRDKLPRLSTFK
ncbi:large ribosomal subunit protein bL19c [Castanea sativa]|uniref:large ribosomal subunit protein bL19c n=1 Tax=Castanea sativa TaxID=21020 RepID=UPI003F64E55B